MPDFGPNDVDWLIRGQFPAHAPACFQGRWLRVGIVRALGKIVFSADGVAPISAEEKAWLESHLDHMAEALGGDPSSRYRVPTEGRN